MCAKNLALFARKEAPILTSICMFIYSAIIGTIDIFSVKIKYIQYKPQHACLSRVLAPESMTLIDRAPRRVNDLTT